MFGIEELFILPRNNIWSAHPSNLPLETSLAAIIHCSRELVWRIEPS